MASRPHDARESTPTAAGPLGALLPVALVSLVGLGVRAVGLDYQSYWIDEIASLQLAKDGLQDGFQRIRGDVHPPGYFALLHFWVRALGTSEFAVRWLSVIPSVLTLGALWRLGRLLCPGSAGQRVGLMATAIAAGSLIQIYYAQEARSYAWLMLFATLSMDATARFASRGRPIDLAAYAAATIALLYTHYFGFFAVAAQNVFVLLLYWGAPSSRRIRLHRWLFAQGAVALAFLPWLPSLVAQARIVQTGFWIGTPTLSGLGTSFLRFASFTGPWSPSGPPAYFAWLSLLVAGGVLAGAAAGGALAVRQSVRLSVRHSVRQPKLGRGSPAGKVDPQARAHSGSPANVDSHALEPRAAGLLLGLWLLLPPLAGWSLSIFGLDVFTYRNTMISAPAFALWLALLCDKLPGPAWKTVAIAAILAPSIAQGPSYYSRPHKDQWRQVAAYLEKHYVAATDGIALDAPFVRLGIFHYAPELPHAMGSRRGVDLHGEAPANHDRIWLVRAYAGPRSRSPERIRSWGFEQVERIEWIAIEVFLFQRAQPTEQPRRPARSPRP